MSDEPPDPRPRLLFGKITPGNAHAIINGFVIAWSVIVAVQIFEIGVYFGINQLPWILLLVHLWSAAGVYFVRSRMSRAVAVAQFAYVVLVAFTALFPFVQDGTPLSRVLGPLLAIFMARIAWRGLLATGVHHHAANLRTEWKRVVAISALAAAIVPCIAVAAVIGMDRIAYPDTDEREVRLAIEIALASFPLIMGILTWKYPFAKRDMAKNVAEVFE